ncbi:MAG: translocation/assembly module TamB domain-containing protein, partial [Caldimonas sp.]
LGRVDRRIVTSGKAALRLDAKSMALQGDFHIDEGLVDFTRSDAPTLGDDVEVVRRPVVAAPTNAATAPVPLALPAPSRQVALDLRVDMGDKLRVRGRGLDAGLRGNLHITSPGGRLVVDGTLRAVDGTYQAYGQKLGIDRGIITFVGPVDNPRLDIEATRPNLDVRVGVVVTGNALNPRIRLFSEPDMTDIDKLSWLVLGRASEGVGADDTALLQSAALALLSGEGPGVTDRLTNAIGLDSIGVRQQSTGDVKETIVSLGKQLSKRWYVGYERGLNATTGSWQLIYRIAQRFTVRAQAGGDNSLDLIWTLRWK